MIDILSVAFYGLGALCFLVGAVITISNFLTGSSLEDGQLMLTGALWAILGVLLAILGRLL